MLHSKHIEKICGVLVLLCFAISFVFMQSESFGITSAESNNYEQHFFSELNVNTIDIIVDETAWQNLLDTASSKEYIVCDLLINGERFSNIAIRAKGNSSLQQVQSSDSDRYSFKIEFDHYDKTKTYYGLDKLALNNIIQDNTFMKDYMAYTLMGEFGVASPLVNYTNVSVNGEAFGLYLAVEAIEEAFLQRNYGNSYGIAYKPETTGGGGDQMQMGEMPMGQMPMGEMPMGEMPTGEMPMGEMPMGQMPMGEMPMGEMPTGEMPMGQMPTGEMPTGQMPMGEMPTGEMPTTGAETGTATTEETTTPTERSQAGRQAGGGGGMAGGGGTLTSCLEYSGDDTSSYSYIFDNAVIDISNNDKERLIASLKQMNEQTNLEEVVDIESVMRYFVVHNFLVNFDSYTGGIMHNYYIYEHHGMISMLPWDYNLSFVSFQTSYSTEELINFPMDTPVSSNTVEARPMLAWIFADETYTEMYHEIYQEFITEIFDSGYFSELVDNVQATISEAVEVDPSKFCTYDDYVTGIEALRDVASLRIESLQGQLDGTIPSTAEAQATDDTRVDVGNLDITLTGSERTSTNNAGGGGGDRNRGEATGQNVEVIEGEIPQGEAGMMNQQQGRGELPMIEGELPQGEAGMMNQQQGRGELPMIEGELPQGEVGMMNQQQGRGEMPMIEGELPQAEVGMMNQQQGRGELPMVEGELPQGEVGMMNQQQGQQGQQNQQQGRGQMQPGGGNFSANSQAQTQSAYVWIGLSFVIGLLAIGFVHKYQRRK